MISDQTVRQILELSPQLGKLLAGKSPEVQSAALADCCAMYLAGHRVKDDPEATAALRAELLAALVELIRELIEPNAKEIDARLKWSRQ
jgi:hypothetical protein